MIKYVFLFYSKKAKDHFSRMLPSIVLEYIWFSTNIKEMKKKSLRLCLDIRKEM